MGVWSLSGFSLRQAEQSFSLARGTDYAGSTAWREADEKGVEHVAGSTRKPRDERRRRFEEVDDFRRRAKWFWQTRVTNPDVAVGTIRQTAVRHASTLQRFDPFSVTVEGEAPARG